MDGNNSCLTASVIFSIPQTDITLEFDSVTAVSSVSVAVDRHSLATLTAQAIQGASVYLLSIAVVVLIIQEFFELYYLRKFFGSRKRKVA
ncbi:MAG: hypothetical protein ACI9VM_000707 [Candidatus Azotimanducaceae bacterium]|jgi:hypothetical protein